MSIPTEALVEGPSRLHFGLLNESGDYGRIDGGLGCSILSPRWFLRMFVSEQPSLTHTGDLDQGTESAVERLLEKIRLNGRHTVGVDVIESIPPHAGLGAKTALMMAIGRGAQALKAVSDGDARSLGSFVGRGGTSGIGVHVSEHGGLIADAGRRFPTDKGSFMPSSSSKSYPSRQLLRISAPDELKVVHFRFAQSGPSGDAERSIFSHACPVPSGQTKEIISLAFGGVIPAFIDHDEEQWNSGLAALQALGLKRYEWDNQSEITLRFREHFARTVPNTALCLSSMGPTMFTLSTDVAPVLDAVRSFEVPPLHCVVTSVSDAGTTVRI